MTDFHHSTAPCRHVLPPHRLQFAFAGTPINETLVRDLIGGNFLAHQRNVVLVGGTESAT